ncbi:metallophosphoesterase [Aquimarina addita]|uniref:Metallophosphoesterase n=1 Tax=Aquimarina addita TaxID=870485 RepID=A0ABP7XF41_9FLAO
MKISERQEYINLHNDREDLLLLQISDIHLWFSIKILEVLEKTIEKHKPDLVVLTGDYFDIPRGAYNFRDFLLRISLRYQVVFIKGNHDTLYGSTIFNLLLDIPNCHCIDDKMFLYESKKGYSYMISSWKNRFNLSKKTNHNNIVLLHNPEKIDENELQHIDIILAGHLHGGQVIFYKSIGTANFPGKFFYKYCMDRTRIKDTILVVSKGLGDTLPIRWNCPKEVILIHIS